MALTTVPRPDLSHTFPIIYTGRVCHRTCVWFDDQTYDPVAGFCSCGAVWSELNDPPATEWYHTHQAPQPPARAAA